MGFPSCLWVAKPGVWVLRKAHLHPPTHLTETPYFYIFGCGLFSASLQVIRIDSYSVNCCNFAASWEEVSSGSSSSAFLIPPFITIILNHKSFSFFISFFFPILVLCKLKNKIKKVNVHISERNPMQ